MKRPLMLCLALLTGCAGWTPSEQIAFSLNVGVNTTDFMLTRHALEGGAVETNGLLGETPSSDTLAAVKVLSSAVAWILCNEYDDRISVPLVLLMTAPSAYAVVNNMIVMDD